MGPTMVKPPVYGAVRHLAFESYSSAEYARLLGEISRKPYPSEVTVEKTRDFEIPFEVLIPVIDFSATYSTEKTISLQPGQLAVWFGQNRKIYIFTIKNGTEEVNVYDIPRVELIQAPGEFL